MAPFGLIVLGIVIYLFNQDPGVHIGFRGLPWLDVPSTLVVAGLVAGVVRIEVGRRRKARVAREVRGHDRGPREREQGRGRDEGTGS